MSEFAVRPLYPICRLCARPATHRVFDNTGTPVSPRPCALHARRWKIRLDTRPQDAQPDGST